MTPETSIIVPLFNAQSYIDETILSVLKQEYINWELIIVDDGSVDKSADKVNAYLYDTRIKYCYQTNQGVSSARNHGLIKAKGKYVAFLDADDVWLPDNLKEKIAVLENRDVDWVFSDMGLIGRDSVFTGTIQRGTDIDILSHYLLWDRPVVPGPCSNIVIKKKCFEGGLKFDTSFSTAADQDFCFNLSSKYKGKRIPKPLWNYRVLEQSMSRNVNVMEKDHIAVYRKAAKNQLFKTEKFRRQCFSNLYLILAGSWWKDGKNKPRAIYFILSAAATFPPNVTKILKKI
ncbi:MAG: glycosyltransferase [Bacteroidetes bacterium]|nr:glycosyltransferase [Bacteroidota bacterium]